MPRARKPPNTPAAVAAEKNMAIRSPHSWRRYHMLEGVETSIANVGSVEEGQEVENRDKWDNGPINLAYQSVGIGFTPASTLDRLDLVDMLSHVDTCFVIVWGSFHRGDHERRHKDFVPGIYKGSTLFP
ncbi:hypothetical protein HG531_000870 [Fusarium graminearum]|nr:hypothetical protein HG531_000870 [Fusarium graminearum]